MNAYGPMWNFYYYKRPNDSILEVLIERFGLPINDIAGELRNQWVKTYQ